MTNSKRLYWFLTLCLLLLWSGTAGAAVRFSVDLPQSEYLKTVAEYSVLKYASPTFGDLFNGVSGPAVTLSVSNTGSTNTFVRIKARVLYNNQELAFVVFGKDDQTGGISVPANTTVEYKLDASGLNATDIVNRVRDNPESIKDYLDDFRNLDVMDSDYFSHVLSSQELESSFLNRNTLPNGRYTVEVSLYEKVNANWVAVPGTDRKTLDILETTIAPIAPRGSQGDSRPEEIEFELAGFPAQVGCFNVTAELSNNGAPVWTSDVVKVGSGSCQQAPVNGVAKVRIPIPDRVQLIGGLDYNWSVRVKDLGGKTVVQTPQVAFSIANTAPAVSIADYRGELQVRKGDTYQFEAIVNDEEDDSLNYSTKVEWRVKEPGSAQFGQPVSSPVLDLTFRTQGRYQVELKATDKFGASASTLADINVSDNQLPQLSISSVQYRRDGNLQDISFSFDGRTVRLQKVVFRPDDQLVLKAGIADADGDDVTVVLRTNQQIAFIEQISGSGSVEVIVPLTQQTTYNLSWEAVDAREGRSVAQYEQIRVVPAGKPQVVITSPARNSRAVAGSSIVLTAVAQDADDSHPVVTWYLVRDDQAEPIGTGSSLSYVVAEGRNVIRAVATALDPDAGQPKPDTGVAEVVVQGYVAANQRPTVQIAPPADGLLYTSDTAESAQTLTFTANAADADGPAALTYAWFVNGVQVAAEGPQLTYTFAGLGSWVVKVEVSDSRDQASAEVLVAVNKAAGINVGIGNLAAGEFPQGAVVRPIAEYSNLDGASVSWLLGGVTADGQQVAERLVATGTNPSIELAQAGTYTLRVVVVQGDSRGEASSTVQVTPNNPPQVASVVWSKPVYVGDTLTLVAGQNAGNSPNAIAVDITEPDGEAIGEISWKAGDVLLGTGSELTYRFDRPGRHDITLTAKDSRGGVGIGTVTIQVVRDETAPRVTVITPAQGSTVLTYSPVQLAAQASDPEGDGRIVEQAWAVDGVQLAPGQTTFIPTEERSYAITYTVRDAAGNYGGATLQINAMQPRLLIAAPAADQPVTMAVDASGAATAVLTLQADLVDADNEQQYTFDWFAAPAGADETAIARYVGNPAAQYIATTPGTYVIRVAATPQSVPDAAPLQAVSTVTVLAPAVQSAGLDKTIVPNSAPVIANVWAADPSDPSTPVAKIAANHPVRLYAEVSDPDNSGPLAVVWNEGGLGIGAATREGDTDRYYAEVMWHQAGAHTLTAVATDARGERVVRQLEIAVTAAANQPPVVASVSTPAGVNQGENATLLATVSDPEGRLVTVTWLLDGTPVGSGSVVGSGTVSVEIALPAAGNYRLKARVEDADGGWAESAVQQIRVVNAAEPVIISPAAPQNSIPIASNPVHFGAINIPQGSVVRWVSDKDGELSINETAFDASLSPGPHQITLWVDNVGTTVNVVVQEPAQPFAAIGLVVGWTGAPALQRPALVRGLSENDPATTIRFASDSRPERYSVADRTVYDVDTLVLGPNDRLQVRISSTGAVVEFGPTANGKQIDAAGNLQ